MTLAARRLAPVVALACALGAASGGGACVRHRRLTGQARAAPARPAEDPMAARTPSVTYDGPAPACVAEGVVEHARTVGPGVAVIACEGKTYQCVVTLVRGQVGFNCAELKLGAKSPRATDDDLRL